MPASPKGGAFLAKAWGLVARLQKLSRDRRNDSEKQSPMTDVDACVVAFQCPKCGHHLEQAIAKLKAQDHMRCPGAAAGRMTAYGAGPDSPLYGWLACTLRSVLPQLEKIGVATAAEVNIDTLEDRLRDAASTVHSQVLGPMQVCGWTKL
jgi:hypothetical protein